MTITRRNILAGAVTSGALVAGTIATGVLAAAPASAAASTDLTGGFVAADRPAIFYSPHADDESISMGIDIGNHLAAGRKVLLVLMTEGASVGMLGILNGDVRDEQYGLHHNPVNEGYLDGRLTAETAGNSRWREFQSSAKAFDRVYGRLRVVTADYPEGISVGQARFVMDYINQRLPGASHKTLSYTDSASDHNVCGQALFQARQAGAIPDARFYVSRSRLQDAQNAGVAVREVFADDANVRASATLSARAYQAWAPTQGLYAFGQHSVPDQISATVSDPRCYIHT